ATIHASALDIPLKPQTILQLHRDLYKYLPQEGGKWKVSDNIIEEILPDGTKRVRFTPVPAFLVPDAVEGLCSSYISLSTKCEVDELLLIFSFILDFLCIHPFNDGNGRMSRLLTLLLLYQSGFEVGRFISLERIIEDSKETYYETLHTSSQGWHERQHNPIPWLDYSLGILIAAFKELESRVNIVENQKGSKAAIVKDTILHFRGDFTMQDIEHACPNVSRPTINRVLEQLKGEGLINCVVPGRYARWQRLK
ncbi:MAG: Fic family protein, partial [Bacillota bacterium]